MSEPYLFDILELDDSPVALAELESPPPLRQVADDALDALLPPPRGDPFEWVPANVRFPAQSSATAGYYDFDAYPWHRGVWSALIDPAVREVTLRFPA
ncbi:MAG: hypothetical protein SW127_18385, partial [Actinomycetota bacterium]|nr:hypothetical protein [Actinomycetota bacterium]